MKQKTYRRVTRALFAFLFLMFFLLYLLIRGDSSVGSSGVEGWRNLSREMGIVRLSDVRSGGFIVDELPVPAPTAPESESFDQRAVNCLATLYNEGSVAVKVSMNIYGSDLGGTDTANEGLCGGYYTYSGETDPIAPNYSTYFQDDKARLQVFPREEKRMELYAKPELYPLELVLQPGETRCLRLFFWVDELEKEIVTDLDRESYSVTVRLTSRALS